MDCPQPSTLLSSQQWPQYFHQPQPQPQWFPSGSPQRLPQYFFQPSPQQLPQYFEQQPSPQQLPQYFFQPPPQQLPQYFQQQPSPQQLPQYFNNSHHHHHNNSLRNHHNQPPTSPQQQLPSQPSQQWPPQPLLQQQLQQQSPTHPSRQQQQLPQSSHLSPRQLHPQPSPQQLPTHPSRQQQQLPLHPQQSPPQLHQYFSQPKPSPKQLPQYPQFPPLIHQSFEQWLQTLKWPKSQPPLPISQDIEQGRQMHRKNKLRTVRARDILDWMDEGYFSNCFAHVSEFVAVTISGDRAFIEFANHAAAERVLQTYNGIFMPGVDLKFNLSLSAYTSGEKRPQDDSNSAGDPLKLNYKHQAIVRFNRHLGMKCMYREIYMHDNYYCVSMKHNDSFPCDERGRIELYLGILAAVVGKEKALESLTYTTRNSSYLTEFFCHVSGKAALKMEKNKACLGICEVSLPLREIDFSVSKYGDAFVEKRDFYEYVQQLPDQLNMDLVEVGEEDFYDIHFWIIKPEDYPLLDESESGPCRPLGFLSVPHLRGPVGVSHAIFIKEAFAAMKYLLNDKFVADCGISMPAADLKFSVSGPSGGSGEKCSNNGSKSEGCTHDLNNQHDRVLQRIISKITRIRFEIQMQMKLSFRERFMHYDHYHVLLERKDSFPSDRRRMIELYFRMLAAVVGKENASESLIITFVGKENALGFICRIPKKAALKMIKNKACLGIDDVRKCHSGPEFGSYTQQFADHEFVDKSEFASYVQQLPEHPDMVLEEVGEEDFYQSVFVEVKPEDYPPLDEGYPPLDEGYPEDSDEMEPEDSDEDSDEMEPEPLP